MVNEEKTPLFLISLTTPGIELGTPRNSSGLADWFTLPEPEGDEEGDLRVGRGEGSPQLSWDFLRDLALS